MDTNSRSPAREDPGLSPYSPSPIDLCDRGYGQESGPPRVPARRASIMRLEPLGGTGPVSPKTYSYILP